MASFLKAVASLDELALVNPDPSFPNVEVVGVGLYKWDGDSAVAPDGFEIVSSRISSTGRWINVGDLSSGIFRKSSIAAIRAIPSGDQNIFVVLTPGSTESPRMMVWVPTGTGTDDGYSILKPDDLNVSDPGRWYQI